MSQDSFNIERSIGFLLAKAHQRMFAWFREELAPYNVTPPQFAVLSFLAQGDGISQTELSEKTEIDRTTLGGLIDRLEQTGGVRREPDPHDRRAHLIFLTDSGRMLQERLVQVAIRARQRFVENLTSDEYETLCRLLDKLRARESYEERQP